MWSFKNILALGLFLFGTTFLWMTASFAGRVPPPTGTAWALVNGLALAAVAGFTVAGWAVFKTYSWYSPPWVRASMVRAMWVCRESTSTSRSFTSSANVRAAPSHVRHPSSAVSTYATTDTRSASRTGLGCEDTTFRNLRHAQSGSRVGYLPRPYGSGVTGSADRDGRLVGGQREDCGEVDDVLVSGSPRRMTHPGGGKSTDTW